MTQQKIIKEIQKKEGLTQKQLGDIADVCATQISNMTKIDSKISTYQKVIEKAGYEIYVETGENHINLDEINFSTLQEENGLTKREIAKRMDIGESRIGRIYKSDMFVSTLCRLLKVMNSTYKLTVAGKGEKWIVDYNEQ